jgi:hypothetical protein
MRTSKNDVINAGITKYGEMPGILRGLPLRNVAYKTQYKGCVRNKTG